MVLAYYEIEAEEIDIEGSSGCNKFHGTSPAQMARYLRKRGLVARSRSNLTPADIKADIRRGLPCIIAYQAWSGPGVDLSATDEHGHYAVIVGIGRNRVTLADPSAKTKRIHIPTQEFLARWHDRCGRGRNYPRWGLTVRPRKLPSGKK
jgi:predicted double-glycine peptidase